MLWIGRKKRHQQHPKTTLAPTNAPLSVSEPKTETKINNQLTILKEQVTKLFDYGKGDFLTVGVLPRGASYPQLPYYSNGFWNTNLA